MNSSSSWLRRIAIGIAALLLVLVVAAAVFVATFDANRYKPLAVDWMKSNYDRTLVIAGPIKLSFVPRLALKVSGVSLSESGSADVFVTLDKAALAVQVLPLLSKQVVIDRVSASGVRANYRRSADGVSNIDDLLGGGGKKPAPAAGTDSSAPLQIDISAIELDNLQLDIRDAQSGVVGAVAVQSFTSGRIAPGVASPVSIRATADLTKPEPVKLALDGDMTLALDLARNAVAASDLKLGIEGDAASVKKLSVALTGALAWDGSALRGGPLQVSLKAPRSAPTRSSRRP